jgi:radical SAM superfamily enzyme YgiQ (UPF0313 family)
MKVALLLCPRWDINHPIYSAALLTALLKARGHEVGFFDMNQELFVLERAAAGGAAPSAPADSPRTNGEWLEAEYVENSIAPAHRRYLDSFYERMLSGGRRVAAFSLYYKNVEMSLYVARELKRRDPGITIVFGGPYCLIYKQCLTLLKEDCVDVVVFGEADRSFPRLVDELERAGKPVASPGILLRDDPSSWREEQDTVEDLDELPFADYTGHDLSLYYPSAVKAIHSCRGCVRRCSYCSDWREMGYRQMSAGRIFGEVEHQLRQDPGVTRFIFGDSLVNGSMKSITGFCEKVIQERVKIQWSGFAIARTQMTPDVTAVMAQAGCMGLFIGVESGSAAVLKAMAKGATPDANAVMLKNCVDAGIHTMACWIVGYPSETEEMFEESLDWLRRNAAGIKQLSMTLFWFDPLPEVAGRHRFASDHSLYWETEDGRNTFPERLDRLTRLMRTAKAHGIFATFEGRDQAHYEAHRDSHMADYRRWESARSLFKKMGRARRLAASR